MLFKEFLGMEVARDNDAIADAVAREFPQVRQRLTEVGQRFRRLPKETPYPDAIQRLETVLETCRRDRRVEPTMLAVKRSLEALRDGLDLLRRIEAHLTDAAVKNVSDAEDALRLWPSLSAMGAPESVLEAVTALEIHLHAERAWEDTAELLPAIESIRSEYRSRRRAILAAHAEHGQQATDRLKRRDGFERLNPDQRHAVLRHLQDGAAAGTDENAVVPALETLETVLETKRQAAESRALAELDEQLEGMGRSPTVEVALRLSGREIQDEQELERLLDEIRTQILHQLVAHHRVRLK
jgi:hypothetical protein